MTDTAIMATIVGGSLIAISIVIVLSTLTVKRIDSRYQERIKLGLAAINIAQRQNKTLSENNARLTAERDELQRKLDGYHKTAKNMRICDIRELEASQYIRES